MKASIFKWTYMPDGLPDGHRANSIRPYHGQAMFLMFGAYNDNKMQMARISGI
ncbi:MAG: hypothetical protein QM654_02150 [Dysgonamonadaceae bacterium]